MPFKRLLVLQIADIGDLILTTPALRALRETFPDAQIDVLGTPHALAVLDGTGLVNQAIIFDRFAADGGKSLLKPGNQRLLWRMMRRLRAKRYDAVLIFRHLSTRFGTWLYSALSLATGAPIRAGLDNGRGSFLTHRAIDKGFGVKHEVEYWLDVVGLIGASTLDTHLAVGISDADQRWADEHLPNAQPLIAIHAGGGSLNLARRWEPEKFAEVGDALSEQAEQAAIVLVGGPNDNAESVCQHMQHKPVDLAGQTLLGQLAAVLARCDTYIGADSGVTHIAAAVGAKVEALFGPTNHAAYGPWSPGKVDVIRSGVVCSPCGYVGHSVGLRHGCEARTCMKLIQPGDVLSTDDTNVRTNKRIQRFQRVSALKILGVSVDDPTFASLLDQFGKWIEEKTPRQICTVNPEFIMEAQSDVNFYNILNRCDLCIPDGVGLLWAARRLGHPLPERVTGSDGVPLIAERAAREGWRLFLLGAAPGVAEKTAQILTARYPGLKIAGTYSGTPAADEEDAIAAMVAASHADILFVAYGAPNQDKWVARNLPRLNVSVAMGVGGSFDFVAGVTRRAPVWMRRVGIEWLHRLIKQPWRVRRMMRLPHFVVAVIMRGMRGPAAFEGYHRHG